MGRKIRWISLMVEIFERWIEIFIYMFYDAYGGICKMDLQIDT